MKIVILSPLGITGNFLNDHIETLEELGHEVQIYDTNPDSEEEIVKRANNAEVVMLTNILFPKTVIEKLPELKMISIAFTGFDHVDTAYCKEKEILVSNSAGYSTESVAELTFGLITSVYRKIIECDKVTRDGKDKNNLVGTEINGKTLGIIGTGAIGTRVAQIGKAYGCKLLGFNRSQKDECKACGVEYVELRDLLKESDIVSVHLPLNEKSKNLISTEEFRLMKKSSILINTARGGVINEEALLEALNEEQIAGAGIDVFEKEPPLPNNYPLLKAKNIVFTPHIGFATTESLIKRADIAFANISKWLEEKPQNVIV